MEYVSNLVGLMLSLWNAGWYMAGYTSGQLATAIAAWVYPPTK